MELDLRRILVDADHSAPGVHGDVPSHWQVGPPPTTTLSGKETSDVI
jgi:hypothetical protein